MGNALLIQFPNFRFERRLIPFISSVEEARRVVAILDAAVTGPVMPLAFSTTAVEEVRQELLRTTCPSLTSSICTWNASSRSWERKASRSLPRCMAWVTSSGTTPGWPPSSMIEHDDGQSMPERCTRRT